MSKNIGEQEEKGFAYIPTKIWGRRGTDPWIFWRKMLCLYSCQIGEGGGGGGYCPSDPLFLTVLVIRQSRQIGLHEKESHLPDVSSVVTHTTSSEIVGFYDSSTFSLFKNFVIYLMSVILFLDRNKELL